MASLLAKNSPRKIPYQRQKKLQKAGNINENIAVEVIVGWSDIMNVHGPKKRRSSLTFNGNNLWLCCMNLTDHHSNRRLSVDFISATPESKRIKPLEILPRETIKNKEKSLSSSSSDEWDEGTL